MINSGEAHIEESPYMPIGNQSQNPTAEVNLTPNNMQDIR